MPNATSQPLRLNPTQPGDLAHMPTTPGSTVLAHAAWATRRRTWTLTAGRRYWRDEDGNQRLPVQLREVVVLHVAPDEAVS